MPATIKNLTSRPLFVTLNSGTNLRLSSGEVALRVPDVELENNAKVGKLLAQREISLEVEPSKKPAKAEGVERHAERSEARKKA